MTQKLTEAEIEALATVFDTRPLAVQVLESAGMRRNQVPAFDGPPFYFWTEISFQFTNGILEDGRARLLAVAAKWYPENPVFRLDDAPPGPAPRQPEPAQRAPEPEPRQPGPARHRRGAEPSQPDAASKRAPESARHASVFCVDARGYSARDMLGQVDLRSGVHEVVDTALAQVDIANDVLLRQDSGDGCLCAVDAAVPKDLLASDFVRELRIAQRHFNRVRQPAAGLRLRMSLHHGQVLLDGGGAAGNAVVIASRLVDAVGVRAVLENHPDADLVLALSPEFYLDTVKERLRDLDPDDFAQISAVVGTKFEGTAWVTLPGHRVNPPVVTVAPPPSVPCASSGRPVRGQASPPHTGGPPPFPGPST
ncbi:effector-associated domain EAD1-containing protein [Frankia sp. AiPa1]|uniref:effector-associated domain EAD1-containing protein n=1 Tax=Frankia sp. AiPa1 TaxID=573492 RepID=UPI00202AF0A5|nr:effector-associated domain EAD1-containing protein [Frankia sp. AiPa1]MCL9760858.1 effector-associated domain EAD1-containing protein [Frankia sp. AiPa1]